MRSVHILLPLVVIQTLTLLAQTEMQRDKFELFGGYSFERINPGCGPNYRCGNGTATNLNGWTVSGTAFVYKSLGISGQVSGTYHGLAVLSQVYVYRHTFQFGPEYAFRIRNARAFAHALFGGITQGPYQLTTLGYTKPLWSVGGGLDLKASSRMSIRVAQLDYERQNVPSQGGGGSPYPLIGVNGLRYSAGIVLRF